MDALPAKTLLDYFRHAVGSGKPDLLVSKVSGAWTPVSARSSAERPAGSASG